MKSTDLIGGFSTLVGGYFMYCSCRCSNTAACIPRLCEASWCFRPVPSTSPTASAEFCAAYAEPKLHAGNQKRT